MNTLIYRMFAQGPYVFNPFWGVVWGTVQFLAYAIGYIMLTKGQPRPVPLLQSPMQGGDEGHPRETEFGSTRFQPSQGHPRQRLSDLGQATRPGNLTPYHPDNQWD